MTSQPSPDLARWRPRITHSRAEHTCMSLRGAPVAGAWTVTSALFGRLRDDPASRAEFLVLARPVRNPR